MRTNHTTKTLTIKITPNDKGNPPGKLADSEHGGVRHGVDDPPQ